VLPERPRQASAAGLANTVTALKLDYAQITSTDSGTVLLPKNTPYISKDNDFAN